MPKRLRLIWGIIVLLGALLAIGIWDLKKRISTEEFERAEQETQITNDAFVEHTLRVLNQADSLLRAVRNHYLYTGSLRETEQFINSIGLENNLYENIYLIDASGKVLIAHDAVAKSRNTADRQYFVFHRNTQDDVPFFAPTDKGRITNQYYFRITRRITLADGSFGGVLVVNVRPETLTDYYRRLSFGTDTLATLAGIDDRRIRARTPWPAPEMFERVIESPLWELLSRSATGSYVSRSSIDEIERHMHYKQVGKLPLVMVTGHTDAALQSRVDQRMQQILLVAAIAYGTTLMSGLFFTLVVRQREALESVNRELRARNEEQDRFLSMLSHELKMPLGVIRMSLDLEHADNRARIERNVAEIDALITRCLQADRLRHERLDIVHTPCDIRQKLEAIIAASPNPDRVKLVAPPDLPECSTDQQLLGVILANLIDNALKYGAKNQSVDVVIQLSTISPEAGARCLTIEVSNPPGTAGFPDPKQVFQRYYRAPAAHAKSGSGLGLHIAEGFARKLGGRLAYRPDHVTIRFCLWIPL